LIEEPSQRFSYEALSKSVKRSNSNNAGSSHSSINSTILTTKGKSKKAKQKTNPVREESFVTIPNKKVPNNINQTSGSSKMATKAFRTNELALDDSSL